MKDRPGGRPGPVGRRSVGTLTVRTLANAIVLSVAWALLMSGVAACAEGQEVAGPPRDEVQEELKRLQDILTRAESTYASRKDAAVLLVKRTPAASGILSAALETTDPADVAPAVLSAIAEQPTGDPGFLAGLLKLASAETLSEKTIEALPAALAVYRDKDTIGAILKRIRESGQVREKTILIGALGLTGEKDAVAPLIGLLKDDQEPVRKAAARALARITFIDTFGQSHEAWKRWWADNGYQPRERWLARQLEALKTQARAMRVQLDRQAETLSMLTRRLVELQQGTLQEMAAGARQSRVLQLLDDPLPQIRFLAASEARKLLAESEEPQVALTDKLLSRVEDEAAGVRAQVARALTVTKDKRAAEALLKRLDQEGDLAALASVIDALGEMRQGQAVAGLTKRLQGSDESLVVHAAGALAQIGERGTPTAEAVAPAIKPMCDLMKADNGDRATDAVREAVVRALARVGRKETLPTLVKAIDDPSPKVRFYAAQGLGNISQEDAKALDALLTRLGDPDKGVRTAVADALGILGNGKVSRAIAVQLSPTSGEGEAEVRRALWRALITIQKRQTDPKVTTSLGDEFAGYADKASLEGAQQLYEIAAAKFGAGVANGRLESLKMKLADVYMRTEQANKAAEVLQDLAKTATGEPSRAVIRRKLGEALLQVPPYVKGAEMVAETAREAPPAEKGAWLKQIYDRAQSLHAAGKSADAYAVMRKARDILTPGWASSADAARMETLMLTVSRALFDEAVGLLAAAEEPARKRAEEEITGLVTVLPDLLLSRLQAALEAEDPSRVASLETFLPLVRRDLESYRVAKTPEDKLAVIRAWRRGEQDSGGDRPNGGAEQ